MSRKGVGSLIQTLGTTHNARATYAAGPVGRLRNEYLSRGV